jgi:hypothetical protein
METFWAKCAPKRIPTINKGLMRTLWGRYVLKKVPTKTTTSMKTTLWCIKTHKWVFFYDIDWGDNVNDHQSTTNYVFLF